MKEKTKKLSKKIIALIICAVIIGVIAITCVGMQISFVLADKIQCWKPDYEMTDISGILEKDRLSGNDYAILYRQTGLTKIGVDRALEKGSVGKQRILEIQKDFFADHKVVNEFFAPFVCQDVIEGTVHYSYLKNGDIVVSSSTHVSGWRAGHAGLVTNAGANKILQASTIGDASALGTMRDFNSRVNFIILSPKTDEETKAEVVDYAEKNLIGKPYDPTVGVFSKKSTTRKTQCAHLVWTAYKKFGIDLDSTGGPVVTPHDLLCSPYVEIVQVFGMDPVKLWK